MGNITREEVEKFWLQVANNVPFLANFQWGTGWCNRETRTCFIHEDVIGGYPYEAKQYVLHEVAHLDNEDDVHGEIFHKRFAELIIQFLT